MSRHQLLSLSLAASMLFSSCDTNRKDTGVTAASEPQSTDPIAEAIAGSTREPAPNTREALSSRLEPEYVASFRTVPMYRAAYGRLKKGSRVDIMGLFPATTGPLSSLLAIQNVEVLDVYPGRDETLTLALALTGEEVARLDMVELYGPLEFLMRVPEDITIIEVTYEEARHVLYDVEVIQHLRNRTHEKHEKAKGGSAGVEAHAGMRAVGFPTTLPPGALEAIKPGDHVDVTATFEAPDDPEGAVFMDTMSMTLLQNVTVLQTAPEHGGVVLELAVREALMFMVTRPFGTLRLSVRPPGDEIAEVEVMRLNEQRAFFNEIK